MGSMHTILNIQCYSKPAHNCALKRCMIISKIIDFSRPNVTFKDLNARSLAVESSQDIFIHFFKEKKIDILSACSYIPFIFK